MYDSGKVVTGIVIFLAVVTFPIWYTFAAGNAGAKANPQLPQGKCVEDVDYMRANHMDLLNTWRDDVVRNGQRVYTAKDGRKHWKSLSYKGEHKRAHLDSESCMDCHTSKIKFCDECHNYVGVTPYCWECHVEPEGDR